MSGEQTVLEDDGSLGIRAATTDGRDARIRELEVKLARLEREGDRYRTLFESMAQGFFVAEVIRDEGGTPVDFRYLDVNASLETLTGFPREKLIRRTAREIAPDVEQSTIEALGRVAQTGKAERVGRVLARNGRIYSTVAYSPQPGRFACVLDEVTEGDRPKDELRRCRSGSDRRCVADAPQRLEAVMEALPVGVAITNAAGASLTSNSEFERIWAGPRPPTRSVDDYCAYKAWWAGTGKPLAAEEWASAQAVRDGKTVGGQYLEIERFDGSHAFIVNSAAPIRDASGAVVGSAVAIQDVTELRLTQERFRLVFEHAPLGIALGDCSGGVLEINNALERMLGIAKHELQGRSFAELTHPDDANAERSLIQEVVAGKRDQYELEKRYIRKDGSLVWVRLTASLIGASTQPGSFVTVAEDITQRKHAEEVLRIQNAVLAGIARIFREAMTCATEEELGEVCLAVAEHVTQSELSFIGNLNEKTDRLELVAVSDPGWDACRTRDHAGPSKRAPASGLVIRGLYGEVLRSAKTLLTNSPGAHPARAGIPEGHSPLRSFLGVPMTYGGKTFGIIALANREGGYGPLQQEAAEALAPAIAQAFLGKRADLELRKANAQLAEADRNKNEFLAVLSHELRNPLTPIRNSLYVLDRTAPGGDQAERAKRVIDRQIAHLTDLVDDLLDVTRITRNKIQLQKERLELTDALRRAVEDNRSSFESSGVHLELVPAPHPTYVLADRTRFAQIVGNLLQNSAKFTPPGGHTRIVVGVEASEAVVRVIDNGVGMPPEILGKLFEPFMQAEQTLDRSKGGLGLGLALVKGLTELHGGSVRALSDGLGRGAEFTLRFPLDTDVAALGRDARGGTGAVPRRVLIIEDNTDAAESLREALELGFHEVAVAYDGFTGLERARTFHPEVVLCDIGLPGMDGFEVARALRRDEAGKAAALVALSGYALPEDVQKAAEAGFDRHIAKPPSLEKLEELLASLPLLRAARIA